MDLPTPHARWLHHWLLLILAANLTLAATLAALLALGPRSTALKIVIVLASASVIGFVGLALPVAWCWLYQHSGGPSW
jgi:hypothetical protein